MTTTPLTATTHQEPSQPSPLRSELLTALATPAARLLLVASAVMAAGSCIANLAATDDLTTDATVQQAMHASTVATLVFALVSGLYSATTDYRFGLVDQRLLSEPRRTRVLAAKAMSAAFVGLLYGVVGAVIAVVAASSFYSYRDVTFDLGSPLVTRAVLGVIIAAPLFAVLGVGVGMAVRNQPSAIGGALAWMLILEPAMLLGLPDVGRWLPGAAGLALTASPDDALLGQLSGGLLLGLYVVVAMGVAAHLFNKADV